MKWLRGVIAAAVLVMVAAPAVAQVGLVGDGQWYKDNHNVEFVETNWGSYWGPYTLNVFDRSSYPNPSQTPGTHLIDAYCVDYTHHVWSGVTWEAVFTPISRPDLLRKNTRYGRGDWYSGSNSLLQLQYQRSAWLASQFAGNEADGLLIHNALWHLWTPQQPLNAPDSPWYGDARDMTFGEDDFADWYVVSDVSPITGGRQEFLMQVNVVPEPATIILMGTGLVAVMGMTIVMRQSVG